MGHHDNTITPPSRADGFLNDPELEHHILQSLVQWHRHGVDLVPLLVVLKMYPLSRKPGC